MQNAALWLINPCNAESGYWQNHVDYILNSNASLLGNNIILCKVFQIFLKFWQLSSNNFTAYILKCETFIVEKSMQKIE